MTTNSPDELAQMSYTEEYNEALEKEVKFIRRLGVNFLSVVSTGSLAVGHPMLIKDIDPTDSERLEKYLITSKDIEKDNETLASDADIVVFIDQDEDKLQDAVDKALQDPENKFSPNEKKIIERVPVGMYFKNKNNVPFSERIPRADVLFINVNELDEEFDQLIKKCSAEMDNYFEDHGGKFSKTRFFKIREDTLLLQAILYGVVSDLAGGIPEIVKDKARETVDAILNFDQRFYQYQDEEREQGK